MADRVFSEIFLHITWHTDGDSPLLTGDVEMFVHNYLRNRCRQTNGVYFEAVGGTDTHIHLAIRIEPHICISDLIGELKGASAHETNQHLKRKLIAWQRGYGVVSFGRRNLPWVNAYIAKQREHHAKGTTQPRLEAVQEMADEAVCREEPGEYGSPT